MKAVLQNFRTGELSVTEVPPPGLKPGGLLVRNASSLVSAGTERAVIELARMNPLQKAQARPDLVKKVLDRAGQEGLLGTAQTVLNLVSKPLPLGYSCAGLVDQVGGHVTDFTPGDRVACAGLGYANHAEVVYVPRNLAVKVPDGVNFESASFVTVGAIAMQGVRQAEVAVGESVAVIGLGLVGQLVAQICTAAGCRVIGLDLNQARVDLAVRLGAEGGRALSGGDVVAGVQRFTRGRGADAVIICAATKSSEPVALAAEIARDRARVVALGEVGLDIPRRAYYEKELDLRQSRSYGPGRYDAAYEEHGYDYPAAYVRWTENRNMEAFLDLVAAGRVVTAPLVTHRFAAEEAVEAYALLTGERKEPYLGILLTYDIDRPQPTSIELRAPSARDIDTASAGARLPRAGGPPVRVGVIGAGQFAQGILLPHLRKVRGAAIEGIATASGITARIAADRYGSRYCTSDAREVLDDPAVDAVVIATRHDQHARHVIGALAAGKAVFVEKPLAMDVDELQAIEVAVRSVRHAGREPVVMVGYNRRFSAMSALLKHALRRGGEPLVAQYRVNAGPLPKDSWVQDPEIGGGRIVGEVCHFVDLLQFLTDAAPVSVFAQALGSARRPLADADDVCITLRFDDGSVASIVYTGSGDPSFPKERLEVFSGGAVGVIDNWRDVRISGRGKRENKRSWLTSAKGHAEELAAFVDAVRNGVSPVPFEALRDTSLVTFAIQQSLRRGAAVEPRALLATGVDRTAVLPDPLPSPAGAAGTA